jgi:hypothetical protein
MNDAVLNKLEQRLGRLHAKLRLGIEMDHEAQIFGQGINFFHIENWYSVHSVIRTTLKLMGLYWRGRKNAEQIQVRHNHISMKTLPSRFDGFTLLHISDLHADINEGAMRRLTELLPDLTYDVCVLTGDYRGATFGPFDAALDGLARVRPYLKDPVYGVLGNHDTIRMVPHQVGGESIEHADAPHSLGLPGARRERPRGSRAAKQRDELAAPHSRTSLARATNTSDKEMPSDAAVLRLTAM